MTVKAQLARFALVGAVNTGTYYGCYLVLLHWLPYIAAHVLAFALSMTGSFFLNSYFTYRTRPTWRKFLLFPLTNAANFVITTGGVYLLVDLAGFSSRYAPWSLPRPPSPSPSSSPARSCCGPTPRRKRPNASADPRRPGAASATPPESLVESVARTGSTT